MNTLQKELTVERSKKRHYQVINSQLRAKKQRLELKSQASDEVIQALQSEVNEITIPATKTEQGHFTESVVKCVMELVGECEVPARRCGAVMKTVSSHLFSVHFPENSLPSKTSSMRFADQTHALSKLHISEELATKRYDLHSDGTTRNNKKYVGFQVTLENKKPLALGFDPVSAETAQTLLDIALSKLSEFAILQSPADSENTLKDMLRNMVATMTDRTVKMKCFYNALNSHRTSTVNPELQLEFLNCNAHFLLGLSTAAEDALLQVAEERQLKGTLGREGLPVFRYFNSSGAAACRFIRMTCDTLGPRGDERSGCHQLWTAYCDTQQKPSVITSFRSNRFNNLFSAATALIYHRADILHFFQLRPASNLKQKSVVADASCETLMVMVFGLALMHIYFTGPFWALINSDMHYLDQYRFIQPFHGFLKEVSEHPEVLTGDAVPHELEAFRLRNSPVYQDVLRQSATIACVQDGLLLHVLKHLADHFIRVTERQLSAFLLGGKYGEEPCPEDRMRMQHCQLTNLLGEACFADLDYSMFKSRGATLHHHSTLNMAKRNHPVSSWLLSKGSKEQTRLLEQSKKLGPQMRVASKQQNRVVLQQIQQSMEEQRQDNLKKQQKRLDVKRKLAEEIQGHGGACKTKGDVDRLLDKYSRKTDKVNAIKNQIRYLKVFFDVKDDRLILSAPLEDLVTNLTSYVCDQQGDAGQDVGAELSCLDADDLQELEEEELHLPVEEFTDPPYSFGRPGDTVAVYYDETFYVGQALREVNKDIVEITFLDQKGNENVFKWPGVEKIEEVETKFIFFSNFQLLPRECGPLMERSGRNYT